VKRLVWGSAMEGWQWQMVVKVEGQARCGMAERSGRWRQRVQRPPPGMLPSSSTIVFFLRDAARQRAVLPGAAARSERRGAVWGSSGSACARNVRGWQRETRHNDAHVGVTELRSNPIAVRSPRRSGNLPRTSRHATRRTEIVCSQAYSMMGEEKHGAGAVYRRRCQHSQRSL